jgi:hypothetical protein
LTGHKFGDLGLPRYTINFSVYNYDELRFHYYKHNTHNKFSDFYFGELLKIAKIGQNYIPAKITGYTVVKITVGHPQTLAGTLAHPSPAEIQGHWEIYPHPFTPANGLLEWGDGMARTRAQLSAPVL